jgi:hypothetical protein
MGGYKALVLFGQGDHIRRLTPLLDCQKQLLVQSQRNGALSAQPTFTHETKGSVNQLRIWNRSEGRQRIQSVLIIQDSERQVTVRSEETLSFIF